MDLLLLQDKEGGSLRNGGISVPRFVKPGRRLRGTEGSAEEVSDTYLSSAASGMVMGSKADPERRSKNGGAETDKTSSDQNSLFLIHTGGPLVPESSPIPLSQPLRSTRTLYAERVKKELKSCAARAQVEHLDGGCSTLLVCTSRSARYRQNSGSSPPSDSSGEAIMSRLGAQEGPSSSRLSSGRTATPTSRSAAPTSRTAISTHRSEATSRGIDSSRLATLEEKRATLKSEMQALERKLGRLEGVLEAKCASTGASSRSARSTSGGQIARAQLSVR
jgi:hypothetical protein